MLECMRRPAMPAGAGLPDLSQGSCTYMHPSCPPPSPRPRPLQQNPLPSPSVPAPACLPVPPSSSHFSSRTPLPHNHVLLSILPHPPNSCIHIHTLSPTNRKQQSIPSSPLQLCCTTISQSPTIYSHICRSSGLLPCLPASLLVSDISRTAHGHTSHTPVAASGPPTTTRLPASPTLGLLLDLLHSAFFTHTHRSVLHNPPILANNHPTCRSHRITSTSSSLLRPAPSLTSRTTTAATGERRACPSLRTRNASSAASRASRR